MIQVKGKGSGKKAAKCYGQCEVTIPNPLSLPRKHNEALLKNDVVLWDINSRIRQLGIASSTFLRAQPHNIDTHITHPQKTFNRNNVGIFFP